MSSRKHRQEARAAREQAQMSTQVAPEERGQLLSVYRERRRRQDEHDMEQRHLRAVRKSEGPSDSERALMTATADSAAGTRTDWHADFVRLHSARRVDLRGTPEMDQRLINRLSTAERRAAAALHRGVLHDLMGHAPTQAGIYNAAFMGEWSLAAVWPTLTGSPAERAERFEQELAVYVEDPLKLVRERLRKAVRHMLRACDGCVPRVVAEYADARQTAISRAEREERAYRWKQIQTGKVSAAAIIP